MSFQLIPVIKLFAHPVLERKEARPEQNPQAAQHDAQAEGVDAAMKLTAERHR